MRLPARELDADARGRRRATKGGHDDHREPPVRGTAHRRRTDGRGARRTGGDPASPRSRPRRAVQNFNGHLAVYLIVNTILIVVDLAAGKEGQTFIGLDWAFTTALLPM